MRVCELYAKTARGGAMERTASLACVAGVGVAGDLHADAGSPRQLLVVGRPALAALGVDGAALSANVVVDAAIEALPSGTVLRIGDVRLRLTFRCEPCRKLERVRSGLMRACAGRRGYLARVVDGGAIVAGAAVDLEPTTLPAIDDDWRARVRAVARAVPRDHTLPYGRLAAIAGVHTSYCRAFARVLHGTPLETSGPAWDGSDYYRRDEERARRAGS